MSRASARTLQTLGTALFVRERLQTHLFDAIERAQNMRRRLLRMTTHEYFGDSMQAKRFLVSRIAEQARRQNEPLSDLEEKMLYFSEGYPTLPNMLEINDRFEKEVDCNDYEAKISRLASVAYDHDRKESPENISTWKAAKKLLSAEDHYIMVMLDSLGASSSQANITTNKDQWRLLGYGLLTGILMLLSFLPILKYNINFPNWAVVTLFAVIAYGVYRLSEFMKGRSK
jgi:hypothetical protein